MTIQEKELRRMELQIGELIRIVANINERLVAFESGDGKGIIVQQIALAHDNRKRKNLKV